MRFEHLKGAEGRRMTSMRMAQEAAGRGGTDPSLSTEQDRSCYRVWVVTSPFFPPPFSSVNWNSVRWLSVQHWNEIKDVKALIVFKDWSTLILRMCFGGGGGWARGPCGCIHVIRDSWTLWWSLQYFDVYETFVNTLYTVLAVWSKLKL